MKLSRVILVCTLLLSAAIPTFAAPPCQVCLDDAGPCVSDPGGTRCRTISGVCQQISGLCIGVANSTMVAEWQVASIEVTRPDTTAKGFTTVVVSPTTIAQGVTPLLAVRR